MTLDEIISATRTLAENDQSISQNDIVSWVDMAIDRINQALQANIPHVKGKQTTYVPEFDSRYHEALVMFAVAKYYEADSAYNNAQYFMQQFENMVMSMQRDMEIKPSMRADYNVQQIVVTDPSVSAYTLNMPYGSYFDAISVYQNDVLVDPKNYYLNLYNKQIVFTGITLSENDKITIVFENNSDMNNPPYSWWTF